jgi:hypothetical protein
MPDYRDVLISELADSEACLRDHVAELIIERGTWSLIARRAIHLLHERHVELERLRARHHAVLDELRRYTARAVTGERAA